MYALFDKSVLHVTPIPSVNIIYLFQDVYGDVQMQCVYWSRILGSDLTAPLRNPVCSGCGTWVASRVTSVPVCPSFSLSVSVQ